MKPIYYKRKYYCPLCDTEVKRNQSKHCNVELDWQGVKRVSIQIRVVDIIRYEGLKTSVIAKKTNYDNNYVSKMLMGESYMSDLVLEYLIDELEVYIKKLQKLLKELRRRK